ncbi:MAG TPA: S8 family serine peptidase [Gemmataceae bacterium]|nr:S8 family serine peptidase [Gemmataceae bacterium]
MPVLAGCLAFLAFVLGAAPAHPDRSILKQPIGHWPTAGARHLARLGVERWHAAGFRGRGVKVAVLDSGFRGYREQLGKSLPRQVTVRSFRGDGNLEAEDSRHGILCAEVVHALAPEAALLFANWDPDRRDQFLRAVAWARAQGARVISCSLIMPSWSDGQGGGPVHQALARLLGRGDQAGDVLFLACAGNTAQRHWAGRFHGDGRGFHQWKPGQTDNPLTPWDRRRVSVELYGPPGAGYDLYVEDASTARQVAASTAEQRADGQPAVARFLPEPRHRYRVRVRLARGTAALFHLVALGANLDVTTARGSICFPADGTAVIAVGAVNARGQRRPYSSCGGAGSLAKPDLVAPVPFPSACRTRSFSGTSAAAPQAAALAALWWSRHPECTARRVRAALYTSARAVSAAGHGLIHLPAPQAKVHSSRHAPPEAASSGGA